MTNFLTENQDNILSLDKFNEKEFIKELSKIFSPLLSILVFDSSTQENQDDLCNNYTRQIVLMSDTDSLFLKTDVMTSLIKNKIQELRPDEHFHDISTYLFRFLSYFGSLYTDYSLNIMDKRHWKSGRGRF